MGKSGRGGGARVLTCLGDLPGDRDLYLFGAGAGGRNFHKLLRDLAVPVHFRGFVSTRPSDPCLGEPVLLWQELPRHVLEEGFFLLASVDWQVLEAVVRDAGVERYLILPPRFLSPQTGERLRLGGGDVLSNVLANPWFSESDRRKHAEGLAEVRALLDDSGERDLWDHLVGVGHSGLLSQVRALSAHYYHTAHRRQYREFLNFDPVRLILEGGVYTGDESWAFLEICPQAEIWGFEPFYESYRTGPYFQRLQASQRAHILPLGLWREPGVGCLSGEGLSARLSDGGKGRSVELESIDHAGQARGWGRVDLVKLDVEGAEYEVLLGALETLERDRPQLAICIYHRQEDYIRIPLLLRAHCPEYVWHLGHYRAGFLETVWYGIPRERA